ncbi:hypothetical protein B0H19DRAFT_1060174 [Mycena capillaripes]|nr:hypothetical protein B0H19DRAFT_1060174 [Mycena capillaripes]
MYYSPQLAFTLLSVNCLGRKGGIIHFEEGTASRLMSISELHRHTNHADLREMVLKGMATGIEPDINPKPEFCESCTRAKATRKPFPKKKSKSICRKVYGGKVVGDVCTVGASRSYLPRGDRHSHEERAYFMRKKYEVFQYYKEHEAWMNVQRKSNVEISGSDGDGRFKSNAFGKYLQAKALAALDMAAQSRADEGATRGEDAARRSNGEEA